MSETKREGQIRRQKARVAKGLSASDKRHGTTTGYQNWGCRCDRCREAWSLYTRAGKYDQRGQIARQQRAGLDDLTRLAEDMPGGYR